MAASAVKEEFGLAEGIRESLRLLELLTTQSGDADVQVPPWVLREARGVAFLFTYKVGVFASVSGGTAVVIRRLPGSQAWGPPVAVGLGGGGGGLDFGLNRTEQLVVLRTDGAGDTFLGPNCKLSLGCNFAAGPVGRQVEGAANVSDGHEAVNAFTYSLSKGLFAGIGVQAMYVKERDGENMRYYGLPAKVPAADIAAGGKHAPHPPLPEGARALQNTLDAIVARSATPGGR